MRTLLTANLTGALDQRKSVASNEMNLPHERSRIAGLKMACRSKWGLSEEISLNCYMGVSVCSS